MRDADTAFNRAFKAAEEIIEQARAKNTTNLDFKAERFRTLDRLPPAVEALKRVYILSLDNTQVADLSPLQGLSKLRTLTLDSTRVTDISPLQGLSALHNLVLNNTQVTDLTPLQDLFALERLNLDNTKVTDLAPLQGLSMLRRLHLANTQVTDLTPLQGLSALEALEFDNTPITDLAPLRGISALETIDLANTQISDLRPIADLADLGEGPLGGLWFTGTPASRATPEMTRLSQIEDDKQRTRETLAYLRTLPPWPEPLPWDIPEAPVPGTPPPAPDQAGVPRIVLTPDWRLDVEHNPATEADLADPIKERLYARLPAAVEKLARHHNRYPAELEPAEVLKNLVAIPFAEADMLDIHLQIGALTDLREADARKPEAERLDPDCMAALDGVLRLGPPVTMGHPDVDLFEARSTEYARSRRPATEAAGERQVARGLSEDARLATERTRKTAAQLARSGDTGRAASYRSDFHRNAVIALGWVAIEAGNAATGHVTGQVVTAAAQFVVTHKDAIMATAPAWGQTGYKWAEYLIMKSDLILKEASQPE